MIRLAFRNLFRNKRRSIITLFSVGVSGTLIIWMRFLGYGMHQDMIDLAVRHSTGYLQIAAYGFNESKALDRALDFTEDIPEKIRQAGITHWSPRIESGALITHKSSTKFITVTAVDPEREPGITDIQDIMREGEYLNPAVKKLTEQPSEKSPLRYEVIMGYKLAQSLDAEIGSEISLVGSQFDGSVGAILGKVTGIYRANHNTLDNSHIFINLEAGNELFAPNDPEQGIIRFTNIVLHADDVRQSERLLEHLKELFPRPETEEPPEESQVYLPVALGWAETNKDLVEYITLDNIGNETTYVFLILIMAFGVLATVEMSIHERHREFGIMMALGTQTWWIMRMVMLEVLLLMALGLMIGLAGGLGLGFYFYYNPIELTGDMAESIVEMGAVPLMRTLVDPGEIWIALVSLSVPSLVLSFFATGQIRKLKPLEVINIQ